MAARTAPVYRGVEAETERRRRSQNRGRRGVGAWKSSCNLIRSSAVSHDDEGGQELTELRGGDGASLRLAASLPAPSQLGGGRRREAHRGAAGGDDQRDFLLLLLIHAILLGQLPVHSHGMVGKER